MEQPINQILLRGELDALPVFSHENHGHRFYRFSLLVERLSGTVDTLPILAEEPLLDVLDPSGGGMLEVRGQIRSFNNRTGEGRRLIISVLASALSVCDDDPANEVHLQGVICKPPQYRRTPLGREICDVMLAVNRPYRRADYLPCILWGQTAQQCAGLAPGAVLTLTGRLQSRSYVKQLEQGSETRVAYEISAATVFMPAPADPAW